LKENEKRVSENEKRKEIEKENGFERRKRFKEKKLIWRVKKDEKEVKETTVSTNSQKEKNDERRMSEMKKVEGNGDGFWGARWPYKGTWHLRAQNPQNCWICGQPGHRRDQCRVDKKNEGKRVWKNEGIKFERKKDWMNFGERKFFQKFCLVHGPCGHSTDGCGDVQRALSPYGFFNRTRQFQQRNSRRKPLDYREENFFR